MLREKGERREGRRERGEREGHTDHIQKGRKIKTKGKREAKRENLDGTGTNLLSTSLLGLGFISLGAPDLAVYQLSTLRPSPAPLPGPAPAFVSACHLPGNRTKLIREKHKART